MCPVFPLQWLLHSQVGGLTSHRVGCLRSHAGAVDLGDGGQKGGLLTDRTVLGMNEKHVGWLAGWLDRWIDAWMDG